MLTFSKLPQDKELTIKVVKGNEKTVIIEETNQRKRGEIQQSHHFNSKLNITEHNRMRDYEIAHLICQFLLLLTLIQTHEDRDYTPIIYNSSILSVDR